MSSYFFHWAILLCLVLVIVHSPASSSSYFTAGPDTAGNILLLTAHPDDECMFFGPTISALTRIRGNGGLYSLCLSIGDADSMGHVRRKELGRSLDVLGIRASNRWVLDHPGLKDNISSRWDPVTIADVLEPYIVDYAISTILTFDKHGISGHPNHKSLPEGARNFLARYHNATITPSLLTLKTVGVIKKYTGIISPVLAKLYLFKSVMFRCMELRMNYRVRGSGTPVLISTNSKPDSLHTFVSGISGYGIAVQSMWEHKSQLVWFRYLYVVFSRYMWVNEWDLIEV